MNRPSSPHCSCFAALGDDKDGDGDDKLFPDAPAWSPARHSPTFTPKKNWQRHHPSDDSRIMQRQPSHGDGRRPLERSTLAPLWHGRASVAKLPAPLRRRISSSSSSSGEDDDDRVAKEDALQPQKKRRRVGFETPLVGMVHHYSEPREPSEYCPRGGQKRTSEEDAASSSFSSPPSLWYTSAELGAMKRRAKRLCVANHDLEYALDDAYNRPDSVQRGSKPKIDASSSPFDAHPLSIVSEQDVTTGNSQVAPPTLEELAASAAEHRLLGIPYFLEQRGMERWSSRRGALSRCLTTLHVKTEVFVAQAQHTTAELSKGSAAAQLNKREPPSGSRPGMDRDEQPQARRRQRQQEHEQALEIAHVAARASAPAVRFAQLLGRIDAMVAREDEEGASSV